MGHKLILSFFLLLNCSAGRSSNPDSLFLFELKEFVFKTLDYRMDGEFYTKMDTSTVPYLYIYSCPNDTIFTHSTHSTSFVYCGKDLERADLLVAQNIRNGYHSFCYKTYANSSAYLNQRFLTYSRETQAFIVFHELMHNFIFKRNPGIPYHINEAICDVFGNYGALAFAKSTKLADKTASLKQQERNEKLYLCINKCVSAVNQKNGTPAKLHSECEKEIASLIKNADSFQKDRFNFPVNNAYLQKNYHYSKHYFLLKQTLLKQKGLEQFIKVIENMPATETECINYLKKLQ